MTQTNTLTPSARHTPTAGKFFLSLLSGMKVGHLLVITPEGQKLTFGELHQPLSATLQINDWRVCSRIVRAGDIGFAEGYEAGWIDTPDLIALLTLAIRNENALSQVISGGWFTKIWYRLRHLLRPNTRKGSKRNIHAHYDLGNEFYALWLDPSWTYSSAVFDGDYNQTLLEAQTAKYQKIIESLQLQAGDHVLEIGCGWGGFAEHAAHQNIYVHGITISPSQLAIAQKRITDQHLEHWVTLELCDYRDLKGQYDAVISIEMFEAVGEQFWHEYFEIVAKQLKFGGKALIQSITIDEKIFERYRSSTDFIQQYIFPGGMLPSPERFTSHAAIAGLSIDAEYAFGADYAETLRRWNHAFDLHQESIQQLGFDERFMRIWRLYYAYCIAGFDEGKTNVYQFLLSKHSLSVQH